jgi:hypothetical protein
MNEIGQVSHLEMAEVERRFAANSSLQRNETAAFLGRRGISFGAGGPIAAYVAAEPVTSAAVATDRKRMEEIRFVVDIRKTPTRCSRQCYPPHGSGCPLSAIRASAAVPHETRCRGVLAASRQALARLNFADLSPGASDALLSPAWCKVERISHKA